MGCRFRRCRSGVPFAKAVVAVSSNLSRTFCVARPWKSEFWVHPLQKKIARDVARLGDARLVSSESMRQTLERLAPGLDVIVHPVPSAFGEPRIEPAKCATVTIIAGSFAGNVIGGTLASFLCANRWRDSGQHCLTQSCRGGRDGKLKGSPTAEDLGRYSLRILSRGFAQNRFANSFDVRLRLAGLLHRRKHDPGSLIKIELVCECVRARSGVRNAAGIVCNFPQWRFASRTLRHRAR